MRIPSTVIIIIYKTKNKTHLLYMWKKWKKNQKHEICTCSYVQVLLYF